MAKSFLQLPPPDEPEEDPLAGIANLFDVSVVFIVGLMISLFSIYRMGDLMDPETEVTMVKTNAQGESEVIVKKGTQIDAYSVTGQQAAGDGERLGTAYRLANGQIIYVPDAPGAPGARRRNDLAAPRVRLLCGCRAAGARADSRRPGATAVQSAQRPATPPSARARALRVLRRPDARYARGLQEAARRASRSARPRRSEFPDGIRVRRRRRAELPRAPTSSCST